MFSGPAARGRRKNFFLVKIAKWALQVSVDPYTERIILPLRLRCIHR